MNNIDKETEVFEKLVKRGQIIQKSFESQEKKIKRENIRDNILMVIVFIFAVISYIHVFW
jgi:hypothetical protein